MIYIKEKQGTPVSIPLTTSTLTVDNLSLTIDSEGELSIKTGGKWKGSVEDLAGYIEDLYSDLKERIEDNDKF